MQMIPDDDDSVKIKPRSGPFWTPLEDFGRAPPLWNMTFWKNNVDISKHSSEGLKKSMLIHTESVQEL